VTTDELPVYETTRARVVLGREREKRGRKERLGWFNVRWARPYVGQGEIVPGAPTVLYAFGLVWDVG
jgi:hypothetical protein